MNNKLIFKCYSGKLKKWLLEDRSHFLVMRVKDYYNGKTIWLFKNSKRLQEDLILWKINRPN